MDECKEIINHSYSITNTLLGKGSYGNVYVGYDQLKKKVAIKCCKIEDSFGIPNVLETSIMKSISHPHLNHALDIFCTNKNLYIIQELAVMDLYTYTHKNQMGHQCTELELIHIFHSLLQAVSVLHHENLIHCDIKSNNILIYENNEIKLTDFTLSTKKVNHYHCVHTVCTPTHRPLECFLSSMTDDYTWDERLDIWSLGCVFYEITFREFLFTKQHTEIKNELYKKYVNALLNYAVQTDQKIDFPFYDVSYDQVNLNPLFLQSIKDINTFIKSLLQIDQNLRPTAKELLKNNLFNQLTCTNPTLCHLPKKKLNISEEARIIRYIQQCTNHATVQNMAYDLYLKINLDDLSEQYKAIGAAWIASKMILDTTTLMTHPLQPEEILSIERELVHHLQFRLHY